MKQRKVWKNMKLSVELYTLSKRFGDCEAIKLTKKCGFDAIDYSYYWDKEKEVLGENYREFAQNIRKCLEENDMYCNQAHAPFSFAYENKMDISDEKYLWLVRSLESAAILGAENIVVHSVNVPTGVDFEEYNTLFYKSLVKYCEKFKIHIAVENLFSIDTKRKCVKGKIGTAEELNRIVKKIDSPWVVACVDIGHAALTGNEPENFIEQMSSNTLKSLHVQDNDYVSDRHTVPYLGELNWTAIMQSLKRIEYAGDLTFEIFNYLKRFPDELIPEALRFAASVGRYLISIYDN